MVPCLGDALAVVGFKEITSNEFQVLIVKSRTQGTPLSFLNQETSFSITVVFIRPFHSGELNSARGFFK